MSEEGPAGRRISFIMILIVLATISLLIVSFYYMISAYGNQGIDLGYVALMGAMGLAFLTYMLLQTRRKTLKLTLQVQRVATTILCQKCGFKNIRDFQRGDYIFKEAEECPKCKEKMMIASIYREVEEKGKKD